MTEEDIYSDQSIPITQPEEPQKQSFYDTGINEGRILDPNVAEDIAYVANDQGMDPATVREKALRNEYETGLTEEQKLNREIKEGLLKIYPYAYDRVVLPDGNVVLVEKNFPTGQYGKLLLSDYTEEEIESMDLKGKNIITDEGLLRLPQSTEKGHRYSPEEILENFSNAKKIPHLSFPSRGFFPDYLLTMDTRQMNGFKLRNELLNKEYERLEKEEEIKRLQRIKNAEDFFTRLTGKY